MQQGRSQGGAERASAPPWHVTAPTWGGCKDPKLTKKERKTYEKNYKKLLKIKYIDKKGCKNT